MKRTLLCMVIILIAHTTIAQEILNLSTDELKTEEDYKSAEPVVLSCAKYLLEHPIDHEGSNRLNSFQYLFHWMEGTKAYTFSLDEEIMELTKGNTDLLTMYFTSMAKSVLDNPNKKLTNEQVKYMATEYLIYYCSDPLNKLKPSKKIKKLIKNSSK